MSMMSASEEGCSEREDFLTQNGLCVEATEDHQSSCGQDQTSNRMCQGISNNKKCAGCTCVVAIATAIIVIAVVFINTEDKNGQQHANVSTVQHNILSLIEEKLFPEGDAYCSIKIPANSSRLEAQSCHNRPQNCFECNGTCLGADVIRGTLNQHITCNNSHHYIDCCVVLTASGNGQCGDHGDLVCIESKMPPVCRCHLGWTGPYCNETDLVKALCKCHIADQNKEPNCSSVDRPKDWHFCLHVLSNGTKCICANTNSGFFGDAKTNVDCFIDRPHKNYVHP